MFPSESSYPHGPPLLGRVRVATPFPGVGARMRPSDSPAASAAASVVPRRRPTTTRTLFRTGRACLRRHTARRRLGGWVLRRPSWIRGPSGASQVTGPSSSHAPRPNTPPGAAPPRPMTVSSPAAFRVPELLGSPDKRVFGADLLVAHGLACLRIHRGVTTTMARLATDLPGWALIGRDSHPLDDKRTFVTLPHRHFLSDQHGLVAPGIRPPSATWMRCRYALYEMLAAFFGEISSGTRPPGT